MMGHIGNHCNLSIVGDMQIASKVIVQEGERLAKWKSNTYLLKLLTHWIIWCDFFIELNFQEVCSFDHFYIILSYLWDSNIVWTYIQL